jgi:hypothetical protein
VKSLDDPQWAQKFEDPYEAFGKFEFWAIPGNHDWEGNMQAQLDYTFVSPRWRMPAFSYQIPNLPDWLNIYGLDTQKLNPTMVEKAKDHLCSAQGWKILAGHHPAFSNGNHGGNLKLWNQIKSLFSNCGVDIYLAGHEHDVEHLQNKYGNFFILGTGGAELRTVKKIKSTAQLKQLFTYEDYAYAIIKVTKTKLIFIVYNTSGEIIYSWAKTKLN